MLERASSGRGYRGGAYEIMGDDGIDALHLADRPTPEPGPGEVLVRIRESSINRRDP